MSTNEHSTPMNEVFGDLTSVLSGVTTVIPSLISGVASDVSNILNDTDITIPALISGASVDILAVSSAVTTVNNYVSGLPGLDNPYKSRGVFSRSGATFATVFATTKPCFAFIQAWSDDSASAPAEVCVYAGQPIDGNLVAYAKLAAGTSQVVCCFPSYFDPYITVQCKSDGSVPVRVGITVNTDGGSTNTDYTTGDDLYVIKNNPTLKTGSSTTIEIADHSSALLQWILIKPDLSSISSTDAIQQALLYLKSQDTDSYVNMRIHAMLQSWVVSQATWNEYSTGNAWATPGCGDGTDFRSNVELEVSPTMTGNDWNSFDITSLVREWVSGTIANNGLILRCPTVVGGNTPHSFYSYNNSTVANRPYVRVTTF